MADGAWFRLCDGAGLGRDALRALVGEAVGPAQVVHVTGARPERSMDPLAFWLGVGEALGPNAGLIEDSMSGELTSAAHWMDVRFEPDRSDSYRHHKVGQPLHTDGAYVAKAEARELGLFYLERQAEAGGESLFVDAATVAAAAAARDPALLAALTSVPVRFGKGAGPDRVSPILREEEGRLKINWNYFRVRAGQGEAVAGLRERFAAFLDDLVQRGEARAFRLQPGEAVFFLDEQVLHGRKAFAAERSGDRVLWKTYFTLSRTRVPAVRAA